MTLNRPSAEQLPESRDWYRFPSWYDILHTPGTAEEVTGLERIARRADCLPRSSVGRPMRWLEPACGSGRYLRVAAGRGIEVTGFDRLPEMVAYAQGTMARRGLAGHLFQAEMEDFRIRRKSDFAFCLINTVRHLSSDDQMLAHLGAMSRALTARGVYAIGMNLCRYGIDGESEDVWRARRGGCRVTQVVQYLAPDRRRRSERVINHLMIQTPAGEEHFDSMYDLRTYSRRQWTSLIEKSPFRLAHVWDEAGGDLPYGWEEGRDGGYGIFVLRKR